MMYLLSRTDAQVLDYSVVAKGDREQVLKIFRKHDAHAYHLGWKMIIFNVAKDGATFFHYGRNGKTVILAIADERNARFLAPDSFSKQ